MICESRLCTKKKNPPLLPVKHLSSALCLSDYEQKCILFRLGPTGVREAALDPGLRYRNADPPPTTTTHPPLHYDKFTTLMGAWTAGNLFNSFDETQPTCENIPRLKIQKRRRKKRKIGTERSVNATASQSLHPPIKYLKANPRRLFEYQMRPLPRVRENHMVQQQQRRQISNGVVFGG